MSVDEMKETVIQSHYYIKESKRLYADLGSDEMDLMDFSLSSSSRERRIRKRLEKIDRSLTEFHLALDKAGLADKEWTVVDLVSEGWSHRAIGEILGCSDTHVRRYFLAACEKMADFLAKEV